MKARYIKTMLFLLFFICLPRADLGTAIRHRSIFELTGDGRLRFINTHTGEKLEVVYRDEKGSYDDAALSAIDRVLRCHWNQEIHHISLKLIELMDHIQDHFGDKDVHIISGYRSPEYNARLRRRSRRVAKRSLHTRGMAMDIRMPGVSTRNLGSFARSLETGGVGIYHGSRFVHVDVGPVKNW